SLRRLPHRVHRLQRQLGVGKQRDLGLLIVDHLTDLRSVVMGISTRPARRPMSHSKIRTGSRSDSSAIWKLPASPRSSRKIPAVAPHVTTCRTANPYVS